MLNEDIATEQFTVGEVRQKKSGQLFVWNGDGWQSLAGAALTWKEGDGPVNLPLVPEGPRCQPVILP